MPGPFPGMDPYLEHPAEWPGVHQRLITYMADTLTEVLPPGYAALMGERLVFLMREVYIDIVRGRLPGPVVSTIEVLSPANKDAHRGRPLYLTKQRELLESDVHLVEIDLLRAGTYTVAAPEEWTRSLPRWHYLVSLRRAGPERRFEVWTVDLQNPLPRFRIPLAAGDPDLVLDLQVLLNQCFDRGGYRGRIDYRADPVPPLDAEGAEWATALLRQQGFAE